MAAQGTDVAVSAMPIDTTEIDEAAEALCLLFQIEAEWLKRTDSDFSCATWSAWARQREEERYLDQQAEIRAETNIPQHLVW